jgi:imidazolonepropionase-like amidohydrolase
MITHARGVAMALLLLACGSKTPETKQLPRPPASVPASTAPTPPTSAPASTAPPAEVTVFHLYKFGQRIGIEHARVARAADGSGTVRTTFTFNDRGTDVPLAAQWKLLSGGVPSSYQAWGFLARGIPVDDKVELSGDTLTSERLASGAQRGKRPAAFAATSGYAPVIGQELLIQQWIASGRPARLVLVPEGEVAITSRGKETFDRSGTQVTYEHLAVSGLVWGREDVWIDDKGQLQALVTRDFEFDHFEAIRTGNEPLIDTLVAKAGADAIAWLGETAQTGAQPAGAIAFVGARVVDGTGASPIENATVVVDGDKIVAVGPRDKTQVPANARAIDVTGATIVAGLWDMHAHLQQVEQAAAYLAAGVTTIRDEGNILSFITAVRDAVDSGKGVGPRVIVDCLVDSDSKMAIGTLRVNTVEDIKPLVEKAVKAGCAEIKIYSSLRPALVKPLAAEAHRRKLRVTGHVPNGMDLDDALDAGFDGVNHITHVTGLALPKQQTERQKLSRADVEQRLLAIDYKSAPFQKLFKRMAQNKTAYDPTIALYELFLHPADELAKREPGFNKVPRELRGIFGTGMDPKKVERNHQMFEKMLDAVRQMHAAGVTIVAGTDIGVPGHTLHREMELYVEAGFTPLEALQSATIVPARVLGRDKELGTVTVGKRADLLIVDGDPLADIKALRKVRLVVSRGRAYEPGAMWKLAGFQP